MPASIHTNNSTKREKGRPITDAEWQLVRDVLERAILRAESRKAPGEKTEGDSGEVPVCAKHNPKIGKNEYSRSPIAGLSQENHSNKNKMREPYRA